MIERKDINVGSWIIEDDPEELGQTPYKGKVTKIEPLGDGKSPYSYVATIKLDAESMKLDRIKNICPDGIMRCFPMSISLDKKKMLSNDGPEL